MPKKRLPSAADVEKALTRPISGLDDPLLSEMDKYVLGILKDSSASARVKATAAQIGLKLLQVKKAVIGDGDDGDFFEK